MISDVIEVNASGAIQQLKMFADEADRAAAAMEKLKAGGAGMASSDKMAISMEKAAAAIEKAAQRAAASMGRLSTAARGATGGLDSAAASADKAAGADDRLAGAADAAAGALDKQAVAGERAGKAGEKAAVGGTKFWGGLKTVMLGAGVAAAYGIDKAMQFQSEMLLLHTQAGVSMKDTQAMSKGVLLISTQTGQSLTSVAEAAYHVSSNMESMHAKVPQQLDVLRMAAEGAAIGHSNLVDTTNALTSVVASGIPGAKNYAQAMGMINSTVGTGDMSMQQLAESMASGVVPIVKGYGLNLKDVGAALATFGDLNIRGANAGTDLRTSVQALSSPMKSAKVQMAELGLTQNTLYKDMQSGGLLKALDDLTARFHKAGLTASTEGQMITQLFGKKAGPGLAVLLENMDRFRSKFPQLTQDANNFNKAYAAWSATPQAKWDKLMAGFQAASVNFGTALLPAFSKAAGFADQILTKLNASKGAWKDIAIGAGGLAALFTAKKLTSGIESAFKTAEIGLRFTGKILGIDKLSTLGTGAAAGMQKAGDTVAAGAGAMQRAADTMVTAAGAMQRAADTMVGADLGKGKPGLPGGGLPGKGRPGEPVVTPGRETPRETPRLRENITTGVVGALAALTIVDPVLSSLKSGPGGKNWFDNPFGMPGPNDSASRNNWLTSFSPYERFFQGFAAPQNAQALASAPESRFSSRFGIPVPGTGSAAAAAAPAVQPGLPAALHGWRIPPPDTSALAGAKGKILADAQGIQQAAENALKKPAKASPPDLSAYTTAAGKARGLGVSVSQGLASGIEAGKGAATAAAADVAGAVERAMSGALQTHSPSKVTHKIGTQAVDGLVIALEGGQAAVTAAARALGKQVAKAADITSIEGAIRKAIGYAGKDSALVTWLKGEQGKLEKLAAKRTMLETEIADSQQIAKQVISAASIMNAGTYTPSLAAAGGPLAASATITGMQGMAADDKMFAQQLARLKKMGLNATSLDQLAQGGASAGLPIAQGLTQGGKGAIQQVNQLEAQIHASAAKIGDVGGPAMYQAGVAAGQGLAAGIKSQLGAVEQAIKALAQGIVTTIKHDLKIKSPSALMAAEVGMPIPQGVAMGIDSGVPVAMGAMSRMGGRLAAWKPPTGAGSPAAGGSYGGYRGGGGGGAGNVTNVTVHVTVQGTLVAEHDLASHLQKVMLEHGSNNWQSGFILPGRRP